MPESFKFELVSPERLLVSDEVESVVIPGIDGEMTVMAKHAPVLSTLKPGVVTTAKPGGERERYVVFGGFADIAPDSCTLLAESATPVADLDPADIAERLRNARDDVADARDEAARTKAEMLVSNLEVLDSVVAAAR
ncbi:MAG: F0F1 ATP synthase subunit epsilon [Pseudomonadota bacterium]|nr:F0F1 ATP synthase subunit epsilon [Pseudomonadota bacterium]